MLTPSESAYIIITNGCISGLSCITNEVTLVSKGVAKPSVIRSHLPNLSYNYRHLYVFLKLLFKPVLLRA